MVRKDSVLCFADPLKSGLHFSDKTGECALCRVGLPVRAEE